MMKNGFNSKIAFWGNNYKPYVRTVTFNNSLSGMPVVVRVRICVLMYLMILTRRKRYMLI